MKTPSSASLVQRILPCPACQQPAVAHVSMDDSEPCGLRVVCVAGCPNTDGYLVAALDSLYPLAVSA